MREQHKLGALPRLARFDVRVVKPAQIDDLIHPIRPIHQKPLEVIPRIAREEAESAVCPAVVKPLHIEGAEAVTVVLVQPQIEEMRAIGGKRQIAERVQPPTSKLQPRLLGLTHCPQPKELREYDLG